MKASRRLTDKVFIWEQKSVYTNVRWWKHYGNKIECINFIQALAVISKSKATLFIFYSYIILLCIIEQIKLSFFVHFISTLIVYARRNINIEHYQVATSLEIQTTAHFSWWDYRLCCHCKWGIYFLGHVISS